MRRLAVALCVSGAVGRRVPVAVALCTLVALAGCGRPPLRNADASRDTRAAFNWDQDECRRNNRYRDSHRRWGESRHQPYLVVDEEAAAECMKARGWRPRDPR